MGNSKVPTSISRLFIERKEIERFSITSEPNTTTLEFDSHSHSFYEVV
jgi:hypothetical protein